MNSSGEGLIPSREVMMNNPEAKHDGTHCDHACPFFQPFDHPFYHHSVWCSYLLRSLGYYDGTLADCTRLEPDETLDRIRHAANWIDREVM